MSRYLIVDAYNVDHVLGRVDAATPLEALDAYSIGEGFAPYSGNEEMLEGVYELPPHGWVGAPFTDHEILARPLPAGPGYEVRLGHAGYGVTRGAPWLWIADACRYEEALEIAAWANRTPYSDAERDGAA